MPHTNKKKKTCVFCEIASRRLSNREPLGYIRNEIIFEPLNPVVEGHLLVVPREHITDASESPLITARVMKTAARYIKENPKNGWNIITSIGENATQSVFHLHIHLIPRKKGDGLKLPWTGQKK